jgi:galactonate dehydratase
VTVRVRAVRAFAVRIPRHGGGTGTAGSPAALADGTGRYRFATSYRTVYSDHLETLLVKVETDAGLVGWGEAQAPVAPEITRAVIDSLLGPLLDGVDALAPEAAWEMMYSAMRVRGHTGSFLVDAIAGIDIALWDIVGKASGLPLHRLLGGPCHPVVPCYVSGLAGATLEQRIERARALAAAGASAFKVFLGSIEGACLEELDALRDALGAEIELYVDALWRLDAARAPRFARQLADRGVAWLEAPLAPEDVEGHARLARLVDVPLAVGENLRTRFEVLPFLRRAAAAVIQPDVARTGITEGRRIAALAGAFHAPVSPHVSIGLGPQLAAALHFAAATPNLARLEYNPLVHEAGAQFTAGQLSGDVSGLVPPSTPGLGIEVDEAVLGPFIV